MTVEHMDRVERAEYDAIDVIVDPRASFGYGRLVSVAEAIALAALVPIGILAIGIPIVAAIRAAVAVVLRLNF